jgi:O-antigen/teichoic acid export membrane protein
LSKDELIKPSIFRNAISNGICFFVNGLIVFFLTPYVISSIGKEGYGVWTLICSIISYFSLLQLGVGTGIVRYIPFYEGQKAYSHMNGIFSTALAFYIVVGLIVLFISFLGAPTLSFIFGKGHEFQNLFRLVGIATALQCPVAVLDAAFRSKEKFVQANYLTIILAIVRAIGFIITLSAGYGIAGMGWTLLFQSLFSCFLYWIVLIKVCPELKISLAEIKFSYLSALLNIGVMALVMSFGFMLRFNSDRIIIGKYINIETVGIYGIVAALLMYYRDAVGAVSRVLMPRFGFLDGQKDTKSIERLFLDGTKIVAIIAVGAAGMLFSLGPSFIQLWVGTGFERAYSVLFVLAVAQMIDQSQTTSISLLAGSGKQGALAVFALSEGIVGVVLAIFLRNYGLIGVSLGFAIPMIITQLFIRPIYVCRFIKIGFTYYFKTCLLGIWGCGILIFLPVSLTHPEIYINRWSYFIVSVMLLCILYVFAVTLLVCTKVERVTIFSKLINQYNYMFSKKI